MGKTGEEQSPGSVAEAWSDRDLRDSRLGRGEGSPSTGHTLPISSLLTANIETRSVTGGRSILH